MAWLPRGSSLLRRAGAPREDLARAAAKVFPSTLSYTSNWDAADEKIVPREGAVGLDLYFAVNLGADASVEELATALTRHIMAQPKSLRSNMVAQEVGIAAHDDAYRHPWNGAAQTSRT